MARNVQGYRLELHESKETMMIHDGPTLGELISVLYEELVLELGDTELASVMAAAMVNDMILSGNQPDAVIAAA
jgi:hypothetical protein